MNDYLEPSDLITCLCCGTSFTPMSGTEQYCDSCQVEHAREMEMTDADFDEDFENNNADKNNETEPSNG